MDKSVTPSGVRPYHHGDLKSALLTEAETILERDGIQCLTLRAAARAAGVSHAAPTNHFGDLTGLLTELAAVGFNRFTAALMAAGADGDGPSSRGKAMGQAYVRFARDHPGLFVLMFRSERRGGNSPLRQQHSERDDAFAARGGAGNGALVVGARLFDVVTRRPA
jgi:AcrR family transcriptional regulator